MRPIDADALKAKFCNHCDERDCKPDATDTVYGCVIADTIDSMPTIEAELVKHGRWIEKPPYKDETVKGLEFQIVCSECDEQNCSLEFDENYNAIGKTFYKTRYCPNCGARMDGDGE